MRLMENAEIAKLDVFGTKAKIMEENENETKYQMQCDTPNGFMHCYHLFPGIDLAYSTFEASSCRMRNRAMPNILEIAYCHTVVPEDLSVSISMALLPTWVKEISRLAFYLPNENHQNFRLDITMELHLLST